MYLSIIIPHYNSYNTLAELLDSIPNDPRIEVIVVDDHSDDFLLEDFSNSYPGVALYFTPAGKKGAGAARNVGITYAQSKYLAFCDSDDQVDSDAIIQFIDTLDSTDLVDLHLMKPNGKGVQGNKRVLRYTKLYDVLAIPRKVAFKQVPPWSKFVRRELIESKGINFDETLVSNDVMFSTKVAVLSESILVHNKSYYIVNESIDGLTKRTSAQNLKQRVEVLNRVNRYLVDCGFAKYCNLKYVHFFRLLVVNPIVWFSIMPQVFYVYFRVFFESVRGFFNAKS